MKKYLCVWSGGFPNTYEDEVSVQEETFFCEAIGYQPEGIKEILGLRKGQTYADNYGGHWIARLPIDEVPDLQVVRDLLLKIQAEHEPELDIENLIRSYKPTV